MTYLVTELVYKLIFNNDCSTVLLSSEKLKIILNYERVKKRKDMNTMINGLMWRVLEVIEKNYTSTKKISDNDLKLLFYTFGSTAESALELLNIGSIQKIDTVPESPFNLYKVVSDSKKEYYILKEYNICQCAAFKYKVKRNKSKITCKHVLYCRIALIIGQVDSSISIKLEDLGKVLKDAFTIGPQ